MLKRILTVALIGFLASVNRNRATTKRRRSSDLKIVVIAGEGAVNIIQQKTAVAPIVEVRDRNNLPVAGATVTFSVGGSGASFGTGSTLTVVTNAAGQATAAGLTPTAAGAVQINVTAAMQGQLASAAITQTNFATAQAAAAAGAGRCLRRRRSRRRWRCIGRRRGRRGRVPAAAFPRRPSASSAPPSPAAR